MDDSSECSSRCQLLSCSTDRGGKKKCRKIRLHTFPNQWNDLTKEHREEIRRSLRKMIFQYYSIA